MQHRRLASILLAALAASALSACGGSDDDTESASDSKADTTTTTAADAGDCPAAPWTLSVRAANVLEPDLPVVDDAAHEFVDAVAVKVNAGSYTLYLADYALDAAAFDSWTYQPPQPPKGKMIATLAIAAYNTTTEPAPLAIGDEIPVVSGPDSVDGSRNLSVIITTAGGMHNTSPGATGQATVTGISDTQLCVDVDYQDFESSETLNGEAVPSDVQKRLKGAFSAEVVDPSA